MTKRRVISAAAVVLAIAGGLGWLVFYSGVLALSTIEVQGTDALSVATVKEVLAIPDGTPLARVDLAAAENALENISAVESASVTRDWPSTLVVEITERSAVAAVELDGTTWLVDRFGVRFAQVSELPEGVVSLRLTGSGPQEAATTAAIEVLQALTADVRALLVQITASSPTVIELELTEGRTVLWGGPEDSDRKGQILSGLLAGGVAGTVYDVSSPTSAVVR